MRVLREKERQRRTGISRMQAWRLEQVGRFPKRIQLGENSVGWISEEVDDWIAQRAAERDREVLPDQTEDESGDEESDPP